MGTNYYCYKIPTHKKKEEICNLVMNDEWDKATDEIYNIQGAFKIEDGKPFGGQIHLGKASGGWKFLWNPNIWIIRNGHLEIKKDSENSTSYEYIEDPDTYHYIYPLSKEGIWNFINQLDVEIRDEYGEILDKEEFFEMAINWTTWRGKEAADAESYHKEHPNERFYNIDTEYKRALKAEGFDVTEYSDFYSDGLRFATYNEFL